METPPGPLEPSAASPRPFPAHHLMHAHHKNIKKGTERLDKRSGTGVSGHPKKSGHGGKFTWDGPTTAEDDVEDVVIALDEKDPNYVDEQTEGEVKANAFDDSEGPGGVVPVKVITVPDAQPNS